MKLQLLVAAMHTDAITLAENMQIDSDTIIVSQGEFYAFEEIEYNFFAQSYVPQQTTILGFISAISSHISFLYSSLHRILSKTSGLLLDGPAIFLIFINAFPNKFPPHNLESRNFAVGFL